MEVFTSVKSLRQYLDQQLLQQKTVGLVPTMGALHEGHISLIEAARKDTDIVVCSVFVNPTQFNNPEDLAKYPRTFEADRAMLENAGCSAVFAPSVEEMYPEQPVVKMNFGALETVMEGASRPGHFNGVGIVVSKLFNIVRPHRAYFGQKDLQQVSVVRQLVSDLAFGLELIVCPTVREKDGLAMSSRNTRLDATERAIAPHIYRILAGAGEELNAGRKVSEVVSWAKSEFGKIKEFTLDYFEVINLKTLLPIEKTGPAGSNAICVATLLGPVRLIDNIVF
ncbi:pantoate--beta-alanine ligase [Dyadobacter fermentans]|uniref:Pantothenate synthetase n=1 Tax=Dyadobacter fermentans (strain ATCC 700827 / DSM 18053 / CIP 107007 / KCTC 52180 / NS114) TaxID=471854 RepID=C6W3R0_DYAFD|nr:pantoate--beta-alanine ligase [Dyadobacter fermentans]ACT95758.1 pantoate/beta-alanine ligase [Dyadobacter fermentans DSM 18053]